MKLPKNFFEKSTVEVAKNLLGCYLIHGDCVGKIVETEAYLFDDPASHSFNGKTARNSVMFDEAGKAYVYFTYGMHYCFNAVTNKKGIGEAVLIRALEPVSGLELMKKRRKTDDVRNLCSGPAKLVQAMGISKEDNDADLIYGKLRIEVGEVAGEVVSAKRIGIVKGADLMHRFYIKNSEFVSKQ